MPTQIGRNAKERQSRQDGGTVEVEKEEGYSAEEVIHSLTGGKIPPRRGGSGEDKGRGGRRVDSDPPRRRPPQGPQQQVQVPKIYYTMLLLVSLLVAAVVIWQVWKDSQGTRETVQTARDVKTAVEKTVEAVLGGKTKAGTVVPGETPWSPAAEEVEELPAPEEAEAKDYLQVVKKEVWQTIWAANEDKGWQTPVILTRQGAASHIEWYKARGLQEPLNLIEAILALSELLNTTPRDWEAIAKAAAKAEEVGQFSEEEKKTGPVELVKRLYETEKAMAATPTPVPTSWVPPKESATTPAWKPPAQATAAPAPAPTPAATPIPAATPTKTVDQLWADACTQFPTCEQFRGGCYGPEHNMWDCIARLSKPLAEAEFTVDGKQAGYFAAYSTVYSSLIAEGRDPDEVGQEEIDQILEFARTESLDVEVATRRWEQARRRIAVKNAAAATADRVKDFLAWAKEGGDQIDIWGRERGLWGWEESPTPRSTLVLVITNPTSTRRPTATPTPIPTATPITITNPLVWNGTGWATVTPTPPPTAYLPIPTKGWEPTATPTPVPTLGFTITSGTPSPTPPWDYELSPSPTPTPLGW